MQEVEYEQAVRGRFPTARDFQAVSGGGLLNRQIIGWTFEVEVPDNPHGNRFLWVTLDQHITRDPSFSRTDAMMKMQSFVRVQAQVARGRRDARSVTARGSIGTATTGDNDRVHGDGR